MEALTFAFIDSRGRKYFNYEDDMQMPLVRKGKLDDMLTALSAGLSGDELEMIITAFEQSLNGLLNAADKKVKVEHVARLGFIVEEIKKRKATILHPDIFLDILSVVYIREDEVPHVWDNDIFEQKRRDLKAEMEGGLSDFFVSAPVRKFLPFTDISAEKLRQYLTEKDKEVQAMKKILKSFSSVGSGRLSESLSEN